MWTITKSNTYYEPNGLLEEIPHAFELPTQIKLL